MGKNLLLFNYQALFLWILIDILNLNTIIFTTIVSVSLYSVKFAVFVWIRLVTNHFLKYNLINLPLVVVRILTIWFLVDILGLWASASVIIVGISFFILRFAFLSKAGMIENGL